MFYMFFPQLRAVESIRRKHETVKRSVEATHDSTSPYTTTAVVTPSTTEAPPLYYHTSQSPPDLAVSASTIESSVSYQPRSTVADEWKDRKSDHSNGYYPPTSADSRLYPPSCIASDPRPYPPSSVDPRPYTVSQEWLSHEAPHSSRYEDTLQSQLNQLDITSSSSTGYGSNGRGYTSAEPHSTSYDGSQKMTGVYSYSTVRDMTVTSGSSYPVVSTPRSTEDELRERIRHLEQQVHDKDRTIEGMTYSGPKPLTQDTASLGQKSPHHSGLVHSFSGPVLHQYSPQNTMVCNYMNRIRIHFIHIGFMFICSIYTGVCSSSTGVTSLPARKWDCVLHYFIPPSMERSPQWATNCTFSSTPPHTSQYWLFNACCQWSSCSSVAADTQTGKQAHSVYYCQFEDTVYQAALSL